MIRKHSVVRSQSELATKPKKTRITSNSCLVRRSDTESQSETTAVSVKRGKSFSHVVVKPYWVIL